MMPKSIFKNSIFALLIGGFTTGLFSCKNSTPASPDATLAFENVLPKPVSSKTTGNTFFLTKETNIVLASTDEEVAAIGQYLSSKLRPATGYELAVIQSTGGVPTHSIYLETKEDAQLGAEGYELTVSEESIKLSANKAEGLF